MPTVQPVRFWPDHFLLGAHPLSVILEIGICNETAQMKRSGYKYILVALKGNFSFQCFIGFVLLTVLISTGS